MKENPHIDYIRQSLSLLPSRPGIYQFFSGNGELLYVGKAKDLKKRVSSYFNKSHDSRKLDVLVGKIAEIKHFVVDSESDALLLENNLIKEHQPRYNVLLKDDKTFPWICIKNEPFPRVYSTRTVINDGSEYFGPYTSVVMVRTLLTLIRQLYKLRTCSLALSTDNIAKKKFKVCLEYHLGNCKAPCVALQSSSDYLDSVQQIRNILKGNIVQVMNYLRDTMQQMASAYKYEEAAAIKDKIEILEKYRSKSTIVNPSIHNVDVFSFMEEEDFAVINFLKVMDGAVVQAHTMELKKKLDESKEDLLLLAIINLRTRLASQVDEIIVPFKPQMSLGNVTFTVPKIGDKKKLLDLSQHNAQHYLLNRKKQLSEKSPVSAAERILETMRKDLRLNTPPRWIECFDNSNIQGSNPVASCVVFKNAKPSKADYRHFNIKTVTGPDDFSSMKEIIGRRYSRLLDEKTGLPDLVIIDGGKGQLNAALEILDELNLHGSLPIIGIAKRLEEIYFPGDKYPLYLDKNSETLRIIQHLRNEAHRFAITFHRTKRSASFIHSELEEIRGLGDKSIEILLKSWKTIDQIKNLSLQDLEKNLGKSKASLVFGHFHKKQNL